jgi:predicted negative regulator of RcsB-dependent stress response
MDKDLSPAPRAICLLGDADPRVSLRFTLGFMLSSASRTGVLVSKRRIEVTCACLLVFLLIANPAFSQRRSAVTSRAVAASLTITTEPNAIIWIDDIRRGVTDASGSIELKKISAGRHTLRVRAIGFKESTTPLIAGRRSATVKLIRTTDKAELLFQQAEDAREKARDDPARQTAAELYREALKLRPAFPAAHVGLARVLLDLNQYQPGLNEIEAARRSRPTYAEASAVEGRINREAAFTDDAVESFRRSIREGRGFQPEAHVGLARVLEDKGQYEEAIAEFRKAIDQLSDSEPVIYQLLGAAYERAQKYKEAVAAYEQYLALAPGGSLAPAIRSIIEQLRRDAAGQEIIP